MTVQIAALEGSISLRDEFTKVLKNVANDVERTSKQIVEDAEKVIVGIDEQNKRFVTLADTIREKATPAVKEFGDETKRQGGGTDDFTKKINDAEQAVGRLAQGILAYVGISKFIQFTRSSAMAAAEAEDAQVRLGLAIENSSHSAGLSVKALSALASELSELSGFDDEEILKAQEILLRFESVDSSNIEKMTRMLVDFAARSGGDVASAAMRLGMAIDQPTMGFRALRLAGIQFSAAERHVIQELVETGRKAEAQAVIMDRLAKSTRNAAAITGADATGALRRLGQAWEELLEKVGESGVLSEIVRVVESMIAKFRSPEFLAFAQKIGSNIAKAVAFFGAKLLWALEHLDKLLKILQLITLVKAADAFVNLANGLALVATKALMAASQMTKAKAALALAAPLGAGLAAAISLGGGGALGAFADIGLTMGVLMTALPKVAIGTKSLTQAWTALGVVLKAHPILAIGTVLVSLALIIRSKLTHEIQQLNKAMRDLAVEAPGARSAVAGLREAHKAGFITEEQILAANKARAALQEKIAKSAGDAKISYEGQLAALERMVNLTRDLPVMTTPFDVVAPAPFDIDITDQYDAMKKSLTEQEKALNVLHGAMKLYNGDTAKAQVHAEAWNAVVAAGMDPLQEQGKELFVWAKRLGMTRLEMERLVQLKSQLEQLQDAYDPVLAATREYSRISRLLTDAMKAGLLTGAQYLQLLQRAAEEWRKSQPDTATEGQFRGVMDFTNFTDLKEAARETLAAQEAQTQEEIATREAALQVFEVRKAILAQQYKGVLLQEKLNELAQSLGLPVVEVKDNLASWVQSMQLVVGALGQVNNELGRTASLVLGIVASFHELGQLQDKLAKATTRQEKAQIGAGLVATGVATGAQIGSLGQSFGLWSGDKGQGKFGGSKGGDYGTTGAAIGGGIGAALGTWALPGIGTKVGAALGAVLGGMLGGAIKKGADEGLATLRLVGGQVAANIYKDEGGLGSVLKDIGTNINDALQSAMATLGGTIEGLPEVKLKVRGDTISAMVGVVRAKFKEMDDAIAFAVLEILKQGEFSGLSETVKTILGQSSALDLEQLADQLNFAKFYDQLGLEDVAIQMQNDLAAFRQQAQQAQAFGLDISRIGANLASSIAASRAGLLGIQEDPETVLRRKVAAWNLEKQLIETELKVKIAELQMKLATVQGTAKLYDVETGLEAQRLAVRGAVVQGEAALVNASIAQFKAITDALAASQEALKAVQSQAFISEDEIRKALKGSGGAIKGLSGAASKLNSAVDKWLSGQKQLLDTIHQLRYGEATTALPMQTRVAAAYTELQKLKTAAGAGNVDALAQVSEAARTFFELYKGFTGGGTGFLGNTADLFSRELSDLEKLATMPRPGKLTSGNVVFDERFYRAVDGTLRETSMFREQAQQQGETSIEIERDQRRSLTKIAESLDALAQRKWSVA